jgi:hypothetical protein
LQSAHSRPHGDGSRRHTPDTPRGYQQFASAWSALHSNPYPSAAPTTPILGRAVATRHNERQGIKPLAGRAGTATHGPTGEGSASGQLPKEPPQGTPFEATEGSGDPTCSRGLVGPQCPPGTTSRPLHPVRWGVKTPKRNQLRRGPLREPQTTAAQPGSGQRARRAARAVVAANTNIGAVAVAKTVLVSQSYSPPLPSTSARDACCVAHRTREHEWGRDSG